MHLYVDMGQTYFKDIPFLCSLTNHLFLPHSFYLFHITSAASKTTLGSKFYLYYYSYLWRSCTFFTINIYFFFNKPHPGKWKRCLPVNIALLSSSFKGHLGEMIQDLRKVLSLPDLLRLLLFCLTWLLRVLRQVGWEWELAYSNGWRKRGLEYMPVDSYSLDILSVVSSGIRPLANWWTSSVGIIRALQSTPPDTSNFCWCWE